jgi:hypothetical protein
MEAIDMKMREYFSESNCKHACKYEHAGVKLAHQIEVAKMTGKFEAGGRLTNFLSMTPNWNSGMKTGGAMQNMH